MFEAQVQIRVRYGETDQMGYVYYGNYALYYEVGRVEALRSLGTNYRELEGEGVMLPVLEVTSKYIRPARYDDLLTVKTTIREMPSARISFDYEILNERGELLHTARVTLVFIDKARMKPQRCPEKLHKALESYFNKA